MKKLKTKNESKNKQMDRTNGEYRDELLSISNFERRSPQIEPEIVAAYENGMWIRDPASIGHSLHSNAHAMLTFDRNKFEWIPKKTWEKI